MTALKFLLVDQDRPRAAAIGGALSRFRGVTLAETAQELAAATRHRRVVLAADEPEAIRRIVARIRETGIRVKVIAYSDDPSQHRMVKAMSAGAADYLYWPCDPAEIIAAANAATGELSS